jgi:hypothetical protein
MIGLTGEVDERIKQFADLVQSDIKVENTL